MNWETILGNHPDWGDSGRRAEFKRADGTVITGTLWANDFFFNGEDEVPIFEIAPGGFELVNVNLYAWKHHWESLAR
jgi:hypothetical protein